MSALKLYAKPRKKRQTPEAMEGEQWRPVPGWVGLYEVSSMGRVRSVERIVPHKRYGTVLRKSRYRAPKLDRGYYRVGLGNIDNAQFMGVHRLVALAFFGPPPTARGVVNHLNGVKTDNRVENLEWTTPAGNARHALEMGLRIPLIGEHHGRSVLTEAQVLAIRADTRKQREIGADYGIDQAHVSHIKLRKSWSHI
jgi:hypothetical protein